MPEDSVSEQTEVREEAKRRHGLGLHFVFNITTNKLKYHQIILGMLARSIYKVDMNQKGPRMGKFPCCLC